MKIELIVISQCDNNNGIYIRNLNLAIANRCEPYETISPLFTLKKSMAKHDFWCLKDIIIGIKYVSDILKIIYNTPKQQVHPRLYLMSRRWFPGFAELTVSPNLNQPTMQLTLKHEVNELGISHTLFTRFRIDPRRPGLPAFFPFSPVFSELRWWIMLFSKLRGNVSEIIKIWNVGCNKLRL